LNNGRRRLFCRGFFFSVETLLSLRAFWVIMAFLSVMASSSLNAMGFMADNDARATTIVAFIFHGLGVLVSVSVCFYFLFSADLFVFEFFVIVS
jgi:hypothetical protein